MTNNPAKHDTPNAADSGGAANPETRSRVFWVGMILALLGGQVLMLLLMVYVATSDQSFAIEPDYYQKSLRWDEHMAQVKANERLGWNLRVEVGETASVLGERTVVARLTGNDGTPLDGAQIDLVAFAHARASDRVSVTLLPQGDGAYENGLRFRRAGLWEFRAVVQRGPDTFTQTVLIDLSSYREAHG
jgi:nitrogen fixation protein FixH